MESGKKMQENRKPGEAGETKAELGIYIHIPFCVRKCAYCDFLSAPASEAVREQYVQALLSEIESKNAGKKDRIVTSIFFGGGTPSLLDVTQTERILLPAAGICPICRRRRSPQRANPGTAGSGKTRLPIAGMGFNRLSIGLRALTMSFCVPWAGSTQRRISGHVMPVPDRPDLRILI